MANRLAGVLLLLFLPAAFYPHTAVAQGRQRAMYVSAVDSAGNPVTDLREPDFVIQEDNRTREILSVAPAHEPMHLALLVDNSQLAAPFMLDYRQGFAAFVKAVTAEDGPRNQVAIITLGDRPTI